MKFKDMGLDKFEKNIYYAYNHEDEWLGTICRIRVGKFMHWVFQPQQESYFTNGCLKEIVEFITKLYSNKK